MTNTKHTPGPWRYESTSGSNYARIFLSADEGAGDNLCGYCGEANAHLIAAAPELLAALKGMLEVFGDEFGMGDSSVCDDARAAITKATGKKAA